MRPRRTPLTGLGTALAILLCLLACESPELAGPESSAEDGPAPSFDVSFIENPSEPFGTFGGVAFLRHTGMFEGETSLGTFRVPYEIVAPEEPSLGNGTVLMEPPHFAFGPLGRDGVLGRDLIFGSGFSYASVGFGEHALNILDPSAANLELAGGPVAAPGVPNPTGILDEEILVHFTEALTSVPFAVDVLGDVDRIYAHGTSQTAAALLETRRAAVEAGHEGLFDFTLLHTALWHGPFPGDAAFDLLDGPFEPLPGAGRVVILESEGDQIISDAEQFRAAVGEPGYRVYEVAGAAHAPSATNPLDHNALARGVFAMGDRWVRSDVAPPPSSLLEAAPTAELDPVYGTATGIARDADLNARGGLRLPDLAVGKARYVAVDPTTLIPGIPPPFAILTGSTVDLTCEPEPGSDGDEPRFRNHGDYVNQFTRQANDLVRQGFLLDADAEALKERAAESEVGKPGTCAG